MIFGVGSELLTPPSPYPDDSILVKHTKVGATGAVAIGLKKLTNPTNWTKLE